MFTMTDRTRRPLRHAAIGVGVGAGLLLLPAVGRLPLIWPAEIPTIHTLADYHPPQATLVYSDDGELVAALAKERRTVVPVESRCPSTWSTPSSPPRTSASLPTRASTTSGSCGRR